MREEENQVRYEQERQGKSDDWDERVKEKETFRMMWKKHR
jgi:hypothetical protein